MQNRPITGATLATNKKLSLMVGFVDFVDLIAIFSMFLRTVLHLFLESIGKFILFPIAAGANVFQAILAWRQAALDGWKTHSVLRALLETAVAFVIALAVAASLISATVLMVMMPLGVATVIAALAVAAPFMFAGAFAAKALFHAVSAVYYLGKLAAIENPDQRKDYRELIVSHMMGTLIASVAAVAVVGVFIVGKFALAGFGVAAGLIGAGFVLCKGLAMYAERNKQPVVAKQDDAEASEVQQPGQQSTMSQVITRLHAVSNFMDRNRVRTHLVLAEEGDVLIPAQLPTQSVAPQAVVDTGAAPADRLALGM